MGSVKTALYFLCCSVNVSVFLVCCVFDRVCELFHMCKLFGETIHNSLYVVVILLMI